MTTRTEAPHHNKLTCYTDYNCRLPECVERYRAWDRNRCRAHTDGTWQSLIDAEPVRQHLLKLYAANITIHRVATATGLTYLAVRSFTHHEYGNRRPRRRRCTPATAAKILAVTPSNITSGRIDATGTLRRIRALVAIGWPLERIGPHASLSAENMSALAHRKYVLASTARNVAAAYELLRDQKPAKHGVDKRNITRARKRAAANRWAPPSYWDQYPDCIDDPHFTPEYKVTRGEILATEARWLIDTAGLNHDATADRLGISKEHLYQTLKRHPQSYGEAA